MADYLYCTEDDIADRITQEAINVRIEDIPPDDLGRVIERASNRIHMYLMRRYNTTQLSLSQWVREAAAEIATYFLCIRGGNPAPSSIHEEYTTIMELLKEISKGSYWVPDIPERIMSAPAMDNHTIRLIPKPHSRVQTGRSTKKPTTHTQRADLTDPMHWIKDYQI